MNVCLYSSVLQEEREREPSKKLEIRSTGIEFLLTPLSRFTVKLVVFFFSVERRNEFLSVCPHSYVVTLSDKKSVVDFINISFSICIKVTFNKCVSC